MLRTCSRRVITPDNTARAAPLIKPLPDLQVTGIRPPFWDNLDDGTRACLLIAVRVAKPAGYTDRLPCDTPMSAECLSTGTGISTGE